MSQPDQEKVWKFVFGASILELEGADTLVVRDLYEALWRNRGDTRKQVKALLSCLGSTGWTWTPYGQRCSTPDEYKDMATSLVEHVEATAYALFRREQLVQLSRVRPYWQFRAAEGSSPEECQRLDGAIRHFTDAFWKEHLPPCGRLRCTCQVHGLNERDLSRLQKSP